MVNSVTTCGHTVSLTPNLEMIGSSHCTAVEETFADAKDSLFKKIPTVVVIVSILIWMVAALRL